MLFQLQILQKHLSAYDLEYFLTWHAVFLVASIFCASPMMTRALQNWSRRFNSAEVLFVYETFTFSLILSLTLAVLSLISSILGVGTSGVFGPTEILILGFGVATSSASAFERGLFGGKNNWYLISAQQVLEGVIRLFGTVSIIAFDPDNHVLYILLTPALQLIATVILAPWLGSDLNSLRLCRPKLRKQLKLNFPISLNALGLQAVFSLPTIIAYLRPSSLPSDTTLIGFLFIIMRVPVSFSPSFNAPKLAQLTKEIEHVNVLKVLTNQISIILHRWKNYLYVVFLSAMLGSTVLNILYGVNLRIAFSCSAVCSLGMGFVLISQSLTTTLIACSEEKSVIRVWAVGLASLLLFGTRVSPTPLSMSVVLLLTGMVLMTLSFLEFVYITTD